MNSKRRTLAVGICMALAVLWSASAALAQSDEAVIGYRQKVMQSNGANMGAIGDIVKFKLPETGNIAAHAKNINTTAKLILSAFQKKVTEGKTDAKGEIWAKWDEFKEYTEAMEKESAKLEQVAMAGDMGATVAQVKALGQSCGKCHKEFRKPKEQSYKNKGM